ncbi:MAG: DUF2946 family protein [Deltaproteobacteria bacterium]
MTLKPCLRADLRAFAHALLFVPFILAQFFASGTMGHFGADGFEVVLCSGDGPVTVVIGPDGAPQPVDHSDQQTCAWAVAAHVSLNADAPALGVLAVIWNLVDAVPPTIANLPAIFLVIPPARAPPTLV